MEQLELYMPMNKIKENKSAIFLTLIESEAYKILKSLCIPTLPKCMEYEQIVNNMNKYLQLTIYICGTVKILKLSTVQ